MDRRRRRCWTRHPSLDRDGTDPQRLTRAYALLDLPVEEVLRLVDRKVDHFEIGTIATVACAVTAPPYDTLTIALAGHPPPVIAAPNQAADRHGHRSRSAARLRVEQPILVEHRRFHSRHHIVLYTDGLVERRGEPIDVGIERLRAAISPAHPREMTADLMHQLVGRPSRTRRHRSRRAPKNRYPQTQTRRQRAVTTAAPRYKKVRPPSKHLAGDSALGRRR